MTPEHAFLQSMLEAPDDLGQPLIFADYLDEHGDAITAELLRLIVAESNSARHQPARSRRIIQLGDELSQRARATGWSSNRTENYTGIRYYRNLDSDRPGWEYIAICFERRLLRRAEVGMTGSRSALDPFDKSQERCSISVSDLPAELVAPLAWRICEYLCFKKRRVRAGQVVPGAHFFAFCSGESGWRHAQVLNHSEVDGAEKLLRERFHTRTLFGSHPPPGLTPRAALLVRVSDQERITAGKLLWMRRGSLVKETRDLPAREGVSLKEQDFRDALVDLKLNAVAAEAFVVASEERLRQLFWAQAGRES